MKTIRNVISDVRASLKEVVADSNLSNKLIWSKIVDLSTLLVQREADALRIPNVQNSLQIIKCIDVVEVPAIDVCCSIKSKKVFYRTRNKIPSIYFDKDGPLIKAIRTIDRGNTIEMTTMDSLARSMEDTNNKYDTTKYAFYSEGYLYLTQKIPILIEGLFVYDVSDLNFCGCGEVVPCKRFLDSYWMIPEKLYYQTIQGVVQDIASTYKRIPDQIIDKNENT